MKYIAKKEVVEAIQLGKDIEPELFWNFGAKRIEVANQSPFLIDIFFDDKDMYLQEGEWIVKFKDGRVKTYNPIHFKREFERYDEKEWMPYGDWRAMREIKRNAFEKYIAGYQVFPHSFNKMAFENAADRYGDIRLNSQIKKYPLTPKECFRPFDRIPFPSLIDEMLAYSRLVFESYQKIKNLQNKNMKQIPFDIERAKKGEGFFYKRCGGGVEGYTLREVIKGKAICIGKDGDAVLFSVRDLEVSFYHEVPVKYEVRVIMETKEAAERCKEAFHREFPFFFGNAITITEKTV